MSAAMTVAAGTAVTSIFAHPQAIPYVWAAPQEGDGTASTPATSSATISVDMSTWVFTSGSSTFSVMGCTALTVGAGANSATNAQYSGTLTTMIDNLAAAINLATAAVVNVPAGWQVPQVRNAVYARRTGNSLELMTRTGSASWNTLTAMTFTNVTNSTAPTWSGGSGGCWGWLVNSRTTIWPSAIAAGGYGLFCAVPCHAGVLAAGDVVHVRSKTITLLANTTVTMTMAAMGTANAPVRFDIDTGSTGSGVWSADGSAPVLRIISSFNNTYTIKLTGLATTFAHIRATKYGSGQRNMVLEVTGTYTGASWPAVVITHGQPSKYECIDMVTPSAATNTFYPQIAPSNSCTSQVAAVFKDCRLSWPGIASTLIPNSGNPFKVNFIECEFAATNMVTAAAYIMVMTGNYSSNSRFIFDACKFTGFLTGSRLMAATTSVVGGELAVTFRNCDFGNLNVFGPNYLAVVSPEINIGMRGLIISSQYGSRIWVIDSPGKFYAEWNPAKGRPTLNATLPDGTTAWQIYMTPSITAGNLTRFQPAELPKISAIIPPNATLTQGVRTLTARFLLESTLSWTKQDVSVMVEYIEASGGALRVIESYDPDGAALDTDTASWSATTWNSQTWNKKSFAIVTPTAVLSDSEVTVTFRIHNTVADDTKGIIIDPEIGIT